MKENKEVENDEFVLKFIKWIDPRVLEDSKNQRIYFIEHDALMPLPKLAHFIRASNFLKLPPEHALFSEDEEKKALINLGKSLVDGGILYIITQIVERDREPGFEDHWFTRTRTYTYERQGEILMPLSASREDSDTQSCISEELPEVLILGQVNFIPELTAESYPCLLSRTEDNAVDIPDIAIDIVYEGNRIREFVWDKHVLDSLSIEVAEKMRRGLDIFRSGFEEWLRFEEEHYGHVWRGEQKLEIGFMGMEGLYKESSVRVWFHYAILNTPKLFNFGVFHCAYFCYNATGNIVLGKLLDFLIKHEAVLSASVKILSENTQGIRGREWLSILQEAKRELDIERELKLSLTGSDVLSNDVKEIIVSRLNPRLNFLDFLCKYKSKSLSGQVLGNSDSICRDNGGDYAQREWVKSKPLYQIMVKDYTGLNQEVSAFSYIKSDLYRLANLGIGTVWLTGIASNVNASNPFAILDPKKIEEKYGSQQELKELLVEARRLGLKVIVDFVVNHVSKESQLCIEHPDWFLKDEQGKIQSATDNRLAGYKWDVLAQFDFLNKDVFEYLASVIIFWLDFGFDGLRLDAPLSIVKERMRQNWYQEKAIELESTFPLEPWEMLIEKARLKYPGAVFVAEAFYEYRDLLKECGVDLTLDGPFSYSLYDCLKGFVPAGAFVNYIVSSLSAQPTNIHHKDGHDIRDVRYTGFGMERLRFMNRAEERAFALLMATMPGVPMFYNGEAESVLNYLYHHDSATPINWGDYDKETREFYLFVLHLAVMPVFRLGSTRILTSKVKCNPNIFAFMREYNGETFIVAVNLGKEVEQGSNKSWVNLDLDFMLKDSLVNYTLDVMYPELSTFDFNCGVLKEYGLPVGLFRNGIQIMRLCNSLVGMGIKP